MTGLML